MMNDTKVWEAIEVAVGEKAKLLAEIESYLPSYPEIQEGDLTVRDIAAHFGTSENAAIRYMDQVAKNSQGGYEKMKVTLAAGSARWVWVLRKTT